MRTASSRENGSHLRIALNSGARAQGAAPTDRSLYPRQAGAMIANVWRDLIPGVEIDLESNFFQIGGDSLLAMRMLARVERMFGMTIDLTVFMARPVLGDFAEAVVRGLPEAEPSELITLRVGSGGDRTRSVFCVHGDAFNLAPVLDPSLTLNWISQWPTRIALTKLGRVLPLESIETIAARYQRYVEQTGAVSPVIDRRLRGPARRSRARQTTERRRQRAARADPHGFPGSSAESAVERPTALSQHPFAAQERRRLGQLQAPHAQGRTRPTSAYWPRLTRRNR